MTALREGRGGPIPPGGSVLSGTGEGADWLRSHARPGQEVRISERVTGARVRGGTGVVNGGPRLLEAGEEEITAYEEGFVYPEDPEFYYRFGERRNPRTLAGVTRDGDLLLVAVDGWRLLARGLALAPVSAVADVSMSLDNVLAVAGAARDHPGILIVGLVFAVALMGIAANVIAKYIERYRWIAYIGLAVILYVAVKMIYEGWIDPGVGIGTLFG